MLSMLFSTFLAENTLDMNYDIFLLQFKSSYNRGYVWNRLALYLPHND